jgi:hypothetical protein
MRSADSMNSKNRRTVVVMLIAAVVVYALLTVIAVLLFSTYSTTRDLRRSSDRSECAREINADIQERFDTGISRLLDAAVRRDNSKMQAELKILIGLPNAQDVIQQRCPAGLTGGG